MMMMMMISNDRQRHCLVDPAGAASTFLIRSSSSDFPRIRIPAFPGRQWNLHKPGLGCWMGQLSLDGD